MKKKIGKWKQMHWTSYLRGSYGTFQENHLKFIFCCFTLLCNNRLGKKIIRLFSSNFRRTFKVRMHKPNKTNTSRALNMMINSTKIRNAHIDITLFSNSYIFGVLTYVISHKSVNKICVSLKILWNTIVCNYCLALFYFI